MVDSIGNSTGVPPPLVERPSQTDDRPEPAQVDRSSSDIAVSKEAVPNEAITASETTKNVVIDPATLRVVFQTIDEQSGEVVTQHPGELQLKLQQFLAALFSDRREPGSKQRDA